MSQPLCDALRQMSQQFMDTMQGYHLVQIQLPDKIFDRLLGELQLSMMQRVPSAFLPFSVDEVKIGTLVVTRQKPDEEG